MISVSTSEPIEILDASGRITPAFYIDRELSWIAFNQRVLEEAQDPHNPLLERLNFLAIFNSNLDEFFMIRVSGVKKQMQAGVSLQSPSGYSPTEQFQAIRAALLPQIEDCQQLLHTELLPALRKEGISLLHYDELNQRQRKALQQYYKQEIFPVLTPLAIDASHPFPFISNLSVNLLVIIRDPQRGLLYARIKVPEVLPRLIQIPYEVGEHATNPKRPMHFVWLEDVIAANLADLFPGRTVDDVTAFRVTRDTDLEIEEDEASDLLETIEESIRQRSFGSVVRLSIDKHASPDTKALLINHLGIGLDDVYHIDGPLSLSSLSDLLRLDRPDLKYPTFVPHTPVVRHAETDIFAKIRQQSLMLHHPFDSFVPVIDLVKAAAHDPQVLAIKQTLYRVGRRSPIVAALMEAREEGKQVATLVELKARFDEENNIEWAQRLENVGVHVVYGINGLKTHTKLLIIIRKEEDGIRRYVHCGTGNYNATTARIYTDFGLLTCDEAIGADVSELFNVLTGYSNQTNYRKLLVAPHGLRNALLEKIEREIEHHRRAGNGHMLFKCNGLTDEKIIIALYQAAQAGVRIDLIVRGMCSLRPGIPGVSETITVRSVVGRFLEHSRIYCFHNNGDEEVYIGSADLMDRNFDRRIEALIPVEETRLKHYLRDTVIGVLLRDNVKARELHSDGTYIRLEPEIGDQFNAQQEFCESIPSVMEGVWITHGKLPEREE
jgi:polyphosphate kinase